MATKLTRALDYEEEPWFRQRVVQKWRSKRCDQTASPLCQGQRALVHSALHVRHSRAAVRLLRVQGRMFYMWMYKLAPVAAGSLGGRQG